MPELIKNTIDQIWERMKNQDNIIIQEKGDIGMIKAIDGSGFFIKCRAKDICLKVKGGIN